MTKRKAPKKALTPPDMKRCQAEKPNGHTFMTLGGSPGLERCKSKPSLIVTENKPDKDGRKGSMTLCASCFVQFGLQIPEGFATVATIPVSKWEKIGDCDLCPRAAVYRHPAGGLRCQACPRPEA